MDTTMNKKEPDMDNCRTAPVLSDLYECLAEQGPQCRFATSFGYGCFCQHPKSKDFSESL